MPEDAGSFVVTLPLTAGLVGAGVAEEEAGTLEEAGAAEAIAKAARTAAISNFIVKYKGGFDEKRGMNGFDLVNKDIAMKDEKERSTNQSYNKITRKRLECGMEGLEEGHLRLYICNNVPCLGSRRRLSSISYVELTIVVA